MMPLATLMLSVKEIDSSFIVSDEYRFWNECLENIKKTPSQNFQDIWVLHETKFKNNGYFVEFGATDGITGSNTYLLEKVYGWTGILAEPNPDWCEDMYKNRECAISEKCIHTESNKILPFCATDEAQLATLMEYSDKPDLHFARRRKHREILVETITLLDLLEQNSAPKYIDYLSVDTEGSEYDIVNQFFETNNRKYNINCVTIEHNFQVENRNKIHNLMNENGYTRKFTNFSRWDDYYIKAKD